MRDSYKQNVHQRKGQQFVYTSARFKKEVFDYIFGWAKEKFKDVNGTLEVWRRKLEYIRCRFQKLRFKRGNAVFKRIDVKSWEILKCKGMFNIGFNFWSVRCLRIYYHGTTCYHLERWFWTFKTEYFIEYKKLGHVWLISLSHIDFERIFFCVFFQRDAREMTPRGYALRCAQYSNARSDLWSGM
jgi:hypothetical protein